MLQRRSSVARTVEWRGLRVVDEIKEGKILDRGIRAEKLVKDPLLIESFELVKQQLMLKWQQSPVRDKDGREYLYLMIKAANDARGYLEQAIRDGKVVVHSRDERRLFSIFKR